MLRSCRITTNRYSEATRTSLGEPNQKATRHLSFQQCIRLSSRNRTNQKAKLKIGSEKESKRLEERETTKERKSWLQRLGASTYPDLSVKMRDLKESSMGPNHLIKRPNSKEETTSSKQKSKKCLTAFSSLGSAHPRCMMRSHISGQGTNHYKKQ